MVHRPADQRVNDDQREDGEDPEHDVEVAAFVGLVGGFGGGFVGFLFGDDHRFFVAGGADGPALEHDHGFDGAHPAAVGAAGLGGLVLEFVLAVAVLAPVPDGVFEAAVAFEGLAALDAVLAFFAGGGFAFAFVDGVCGGGDHGGDGDGASAGAFGAGAFAADDSAAVGTGVFAGHRCRGILARELVGV